MERRKAGTITGIAITAMIAYGTFSMITTLDQLHEAESSNAELRAEIEEVQADNRDLCNEISDADSDSAKEALARERLGLVKPGVIVFINQQK